MKLTFYFSLFYIFIFFNCQGQTLKKKPTPFSQHLSGMIPLIELPDFDLEQAIADNEANYKNGTGMYMFGYEHHTNIDFLNSSLLNILPNDTRVYHLALKSEGALSINIIFNQFYLPEGSLLFVYDKNKETVIGAYSHLNNNDNKMLGTELIKGDEMIIEYIEPANINTTALLNIGMVVHGYLDINNWYAQKVNESGACNMDVICPDGDDWRDEIRAVVRIFNGGGLCSGTLVNNTAQDGTPYILTANHCNPQTMGSAVFRFNYDSPICGSQTVANSQAPNSNDVINGSSFKARNPNSDFGLVELNSVPPANYNVFYAGWDNSGTIPQNTVGIHHPRGDVKKLSFDDNSPTSGNIGSALPNSEWRILAWDRNTTTEGGSSGSGLFDENRRLIGQLHGGQANCANSINDYYGKLSVSWNGNSATQRLKDWLDPNNSGVTTLSGFDPNASQNDVELVDIISPSVTNCGNTLSPFIKFKNIGNDTLFKLTFNYGINGIFSQSYIWQGALAPNQYTTVSLPDFFINNVADHSENTFNVKATLPNNQTDNDNSNNELNVSFRPNFSCLVFPNPFKNQLTVGIDYSLVYLKPVEIRITDIQGKIVYSGIYNYNSDSNQITLNTTELRKGVYLLNIIYYQDASTYRIVKI